MQTELFWVCVSFVFNDEKKKKKKGNVEVGTNEKQKQKQQQKQKQKPTQKKHMTKLDHLFLKLCITIAVYDLQQFTKSDVVIVVTSFFWYQSKQINDQDVLFFVVLVVDFSIKQPINKANQQNKTTKPVLSNLTNNS